MPRNYYGELRYARRSALKGVTISRQITVAVCVITYRRPEGLGRLLDALRHARRRPGSNRADVRVVDNDADESARASSNSRAAPVAGVRRRTRARHSVRPQPCGTRSGRLRLRRRSSTTTRSPSRLVDGACGDAAAHAGGCRDRARCCRSSRNRPRHGSRPEDSSSGRGSPPDSVIPYATTSSVLISRPVLDRYPKPFNEAMRFTGGTDTHLFLRLRKDGARDRLGRRRDRQRDLSRVTDDVALDPGSAVPTRQHIEPLSLSTSTLRSRRRLRLLANGGYTACRGVGSDAARCLPRPSAVGARPAIRVARRGPAHRRVPARLQRVQDGARPLTARVGRRRQS